MCAPVRGIANITQMARAPAHLDRLVRAVHRRHVALHVLERAGLGLLAGCAVAASLAGVMLWRGQDAWSVATAAAGTGAVVGAVVGIARRPTTLAAAAEADRQLRTADLLVTAWLLRTSGTANHGAPEPADAFPRAVLALAAARCEHLSPSGVVLRRLGVRAWGGIALAAAFVATLAALSSSSLEARAGVGAPVNAAGQPLARAADPTQRPLVQITAGANAARQPRAEQNPSDARDPGAAAPLPPPDSTTPDQPNADRAADTAASPGSPGAGTDAGKTRGAIRSQDDPSPRQNPFQPAPAAGQSPRRVAGGTGRAATDASFDDSTAGGRVAPPERRLTGPQPPWQSPAASAAAGQALRAGRVPGDARDLVRAYFELADPSPQPADTPRGE